MVSVKESEQLGNAMNILEALNQLLLKKAIKNNSFNSIFWIKQKIDNVILFIDGVVL